MAAHLWMEMDGWMDASSRSEKVVKMIQKGSGWLLRFRCMTPNWRWRLRLHIDPIPLPLRRGGTDRYNSIIRRDAKDARTHKTCGESGSAEVRGVLVGDSAAATSLVREDWPSSSYGIEGYSLFLPQIFLRSSQSKLCSLRCIRYLEVPSLQLSPKSIRSAASGRRVWQLNSGEREPQLYLQVHHPRHCLLGCDQRIPAPNRSTGEINKYSYFRRKGRKEQNGIVD